ncbi:MAG: MFS transporter [Nanoarchaeota archaeon]|nr:MFS transporter [Nanoarchaeota archaeon]
MGILLKKDNNEMQLTGIARLSLITLLASLATSLVTAIWAIYLDGFFHSVAIVGMVSAGLTLAGTLTAILFIPFIEKTSKSKIFYYSIFMISICYLSLAFTNNLYVFLIFATSIAILYSLRIISFGLIIKDKSKNKNLARNEGMRFTFLNLAWIIGPLIAGFISNEYGINLVFVLSAIILLFTIILSKFLGIKDNKFEKKIHGNFFKNVKDFLSDRTRLCAYAIGSGVSFWWSLIYLYVPIYIIRNNLSEVWIGYFLFAIPIPLILLELKFSKIAGNRGFRRLFQIGYLIPAIAALSCFFIGDIFVILAILILASIGMAMLEPTTEAYFFDISSKEDQERFYGPYNNRIEFGSLFGKLIPSIFLIFLPLKFVFLFFSGAMFIFFLISFKAKKIIET